MFDYSNFERTYGVKEPIDLEIRFVVSNLEKETRNVIIVDLRLE